MRINKKKYPKINQAPRLQFGGAFPALPAGFLDAVQNTDFSNYDSARQSAEQLGGISFVEAFAQDDPNRILQGFVQGYSQNQATVQNPVFTPGTQEYAQEFDRLVEENGINDIRNRRDRLMAKRVLHQQIKDRNAKNQALQSVSLGQNISEFGQQLGSTTQLLGLLDSLEFKKGGKVAKRQAGGNAPVPMPNTEDWRNGPTWMPNMDLGMLQFDAQETKSLRSIDLDKMRKKILSLPNSKKGIGQMESFLSYIGDLLPGENLESYKEMLGIEGEKGLSKKTKQRIAEALEYGFQAGRGDIRYFQPGGFINTAGYTPGTPSFNNPYNIIPGNNITMANTPFPVMAIPDVGQPQVLPPNSAGKVFPGAHKVLEIPAMKKGGKKYRYYQEGGESQPMGVQLELGEPFVTSNADIFDTAAPDKHRKMDKDLVTDILNPDDYVISDMDKMTITRKEAENMSMGMGGMLYKEGEIPKLPKEVTAADIFREGEKELKLSEYVKRIRSKMQVWDKEDTDPFVAKTNAANKETRIPFIAAAVHMNEMKKNPKGVAPVGYVANFENKFANSIYPGRPDRNPGKRTSQTNTSPEVPEMQAGGFNPLSLIPVVGGIFQGFGQLGSNRNNYRDRLRFLSQDRRDINQLANTQAQFSGLSTAASLAGVVGQDPNVEAPNYDTTQLDAQIRRTPRSLFDFQASKLAAANRPYMNRLFQNARTFSEAVNAFSPVGAATATSMANLGIDQVNRDIGLENQYRRAKQDYSDLQMTGEVNARNATRMNANRLTSAAAGVVSSGIESQGNIQSNRLNALRGNNAQRVQAKIDWRAGKNQAWRNIVGAASQGAYDLASQGVGAPQAGNQSMSNMANIGSAAAASAGATQAPMFGARAAGSATGSPYAPLPWQSPNMFGYLQQPQQGVYYDVPASNAAQLGMVQPPQGWIFDPYTQSFVPQ